MNILVDVSVHAFDFEILDLHGIGAVLSFAQDLARYVVGRACEVKIAI